MANEFQALQDQVNATATVEASAVTLIEGIAARIAAAGGDPVATQALSDSLKASSDSLAAAVAANTVTPPIVPIPVSPAV